MRRVSILAVACVTLAVPSVASAFQFTVEANGRMSPAHVREIEHAVSFQVNVQVARYYKLSPVSFVATGGIPIFLLSRDQLSIADGDRGFDGFHVAYPGGGHAIYVRGEDFRDTAITISHEIIETEVDPTVRIYPHREICDPVENRSYRLWGVPVSDWVLPDRRAFRRS